MMDVFVCDSVFMEASDASRLLSEVLPGFRQLRRRNIKAEKPETAAGLRAADKCCVMLSQPTLGSWR